MRGNGEADDSWRASILDALPDVVVVIDEMARVLYTGGAVDQILGLAPEEWTGRSALDAVHPDDLQVVTDLLQLIRDEPHVARSGLRFRTLTTSGSWLPVEARGWMTIDTPQGNGLVLSLRDITGRLAIESARSLDDRVPRGSLQGYEGVERRRTWVVENVLKFMAHNDEDTEHVLIIVVGIADGDEQLTDMSDNDCERLVSAMEEQARSMIRDNDVAVLVGATQLMVACAGVTTASTGFEIAKRIHDECSARAEELFDQPIVLRTGLVLASKGDALDEVLAFAMEASHLVGPPSQPATQSPDAPSTAS